MIEWLTENLPLLSALGAIATVIMLFTSFFKKKPVKNKVTAKNGGVASGGGISKSTITTNAPAPKPNKAKQVDASKKSSTRS